MIEAGDFIGPAKALGFNNWAGVPCSFLTPFINSVIDDGEMSYLSAANEGDAVAAATGAALAGERTVAMMQNSGLGNAVSPLSSLNWVFRIPVLLIVTLRGEPGLGDEPQHELMGQITGQILDSLQIPWDWFPRSADEVEGALTVAQWQMERNGLPYAFVMKKGTVAKAELNSQWKPGGGPNAFDPVAPQAPQLTRREALAEVIAATPEDDSVVIGSTGFTGRELFRVVVVDGDGAALMRMGNFATVGAYGRRNFQHLLLDNGVHESTGGQATVSPGLSFAGVANACGYRLAESGETATQLAGFLRDENGPALLHFRTRRGVPEGLPRPDVTPRQVKQRLMAQIGAGAPWEHL